MHEKVLGFCRKMLNQLLIILPILSVITAQENKDLRNAVLDIFGTDNQTKEERRFSNLVEVTSSTPGSFGALEKCGEGSDEGVHICVPYHQCDGTTNTLIEDDAATSGFGKIDIRFGASECESSYLDVCCKLPSKDNTRGPEIPSGPESTSAPPIKTSTTAPQPNTPRPSSVYCGIRNENGIDFKITGNKDNEAEYGEFPWVVAILKTDQHPNQDGVLAICGGSLIAPNVVLTGAHCVADLQLNQYKVRAGEWDTQTEKERVPYQERSVRQVIVHESYTARVLYNNMALLILESPVDQADNIGNICLPNQDERIDSRNCFASGWGKDVFGKEGRYQVILKKIELPIVQFNDCQKALRTTRLGAAFRLHPSFTCAGGERGKDTCQGDGGSPLVCPDSRNPGRYVQAGIVSWGIGCGEDNVPGVYADVAKFRNWIDDKLSRLNFNTNSYV